VENNKVYRMGYDWARDLFSENVDVTQIKREALTQALKFKNDDDLDAFYEGAFDFLNSIGM